MSDTPFYAKDGIIANGAFTANSTVITIPNTATVIANGVAGSPGMVFQSNGTGVYWSSGAALGVNTAANYIWSNVQTFSNTITFSTQLLGSTINAATYSAGAGLTANSTLVNATAIVVQTTLVTGTNTLSTTAISAYSNAAFGVYGSSNNSVGIYGYSNNNNGVYGVSNSASGVYGISNTSTGIYGISNTGYGLYAQSNTGTVAVFANATTTFTTIYANAQLTHNYTITSGNYNLNQYGIIGYSNNSTGVTGAANSGVGVQGQSTSGTGGSFSSGTGTGLSAGSNTGTGAYIQSNTGLGLQVVANNNATVASFSNNTAQVGAFNSNGQLYASGDGWISGNLTVAGGSIYSVVNIDDTNSTSRINIAASNTNVYVGKGTGWQHAFYNNAGGTCGLWGANGTDGSIYANGNVTAYWSDARLKTNIQVIDTTEGLDRVLQYVVVDYQWNELGRKINGRPAEAIERGMIAQTVEKINPEAVAGNVLALDEEGKPYLTLREEKLIFDLIGAVQEQQKQIELLQKRITLLELESK